MSLQVYVNGLELCTFKHRIPLETISTLAICGDVFISFIGFIEASYNFPLFLLLQLVKKYFLMKLFNCISCLIHIYKTDLEQIFLHH